MEKNFFEERLQNASQGQIWKRRLVTILIATAIGIIACIHLGIEKNILSFFVLCVTGLGGSYLIVTVIKREKKVMDNYSGDNKLNALMLYDKSENLQDVYDYINEAIANNQVSFRHRAFSKESKNLMLRGKRDTNNETILLPKYLLDCTYWTVMAIPINQVKVVAEEDYFDITAFNSDIKYQELKSKLRMKNSATIREVVSIYYGDEKAIGIDTGSKAKAEELVKEINNCLPDNL